MSGDEAAAAEVDAAAPASPALTIVVPVFDEEDNVVPLVGEIVEVLRGAIDFELVVVDDGSRDGTQARLRGLFASTSELHLLAHPGRCGKSAAILTGARAARAPLVATMDGDLQNDPRDVPRLLEAFRAAPAGTVGLVAGQRLGRRDTLLRIVTSRIANAVRAALLHDDTRDTACGLKLFRRDIFLDLPYFEGLHRFLPALVRRAGHGVVTVDVSDRARHAGTAKYGTWNRLWVGIADMLVVWWLIRRHHLPGEVRDIRDNDGG